MVRFLVALTLLIFANSATYAADANKRFAVKGAGLATCEGYLAARKKRSREYFLFGGWLDGYLSAVNQYEDATFDIAPWQTTDYIALFIANHCKTRPKVAFVKAAIDMVAVLRQQRLEARSGWVTANNGEKSVRVYQETMRRAQAQLAALGHYDGVPDGFFGPETMAALKAFQATTGLKANGLPDQPTLLRLFHDVARE